jgi:hypothetical protein
VRRGAYALSSPTPLVHLSHPPRVRTPFRPNLRALAHPLLRPLTVSSTDDVPWMRPAPSHSPVVRVCGVRARRGGLPGVPRPALTSPTSPIYFTHFTHQRPPPRPAPRHTPHPALNNPRQRQRQLQLHTYTRTARGVRGRCGISAWVARWLSSRCPALRPSPTAAWSSTVACSSSSLVRQTPSTLPALTHPLRTSAKLSCRRRCSMPASIRSPVCGGTCDPRPPAALPQPLQGCHGEAGGAAGFRRTPWQSGPERFRTGWHGGWRRRRCRATRSCMPAAIHACVHACSQPASQPASHGCLAAVLWAAHWLWAAEPSRA